MALRVPVASTRRTGRTRKRWCWCSLAGLLLLAGVLGGCDGDDHDDHDKAHHTQGGCLLEGEREPNDTTLIAQILDPGFAGDCVIVEGTLFAATDVDIYGILVEETLTLVVSVDHSPFVDLDVQLFDVDTGELILDCGLNVVPEVYVVPFVVGSRDIAVDVVVTSVLGAGSYTLTLNVQ
jgi:hypothetical protein